ncbi:MAG TPA: phenylalanine--tRNA ligase subunit beta, partial [Chloroflexota bacterium]|nr:phenylalanine--tRNA ligase subunit beta [Chloroflexota bacterium]
MNVSLKWLRDYVDIALPAEELARRLTMAGIEVEGTHHVGSSWENVWVARIQRIERHPNADRLSVVAVEYGNGRTQQVVTGATNIKEGDIVPFGRVGTKFRYPNKETGEPEERVLQPTTMRGIASEGMVMSGYELGLSDDHSGILVLPPETTVGIPLAELYGDTVIELDLKGRSDCLAMVGVAREVAAITAADDIRIPMFRPQPARERREDEPVRIEIEDPELCSRYTGVLLKNVKIGASPVWMQERLQAAGMRPINNIVDITNFVMLEWGQPLHAFDYETLRKGTIVVRPARPGETLLSLAEERPVIKLTAEQLVIADAERPVALAGVIGGAETEVQEGTTSILLESANFKPSNIRRTARALLPRPTEASRRFERGIPPERTVTAALRAAQLMIELAGAEMVGEPVDVYPNPPQRMPITLVPGEFKRLLGVDYDAETIEGIFDRLRFIYQKPDQATNGGSYVVQPPAWRLDIERPADLVEEVARIDGYHRIPTTLMVGEPPFPQPNIPLMWEEAVRDVLVAAGFSEVITYAWTSEKAMARFPRATEEGPASNLAELVDSRVAPATEPVRIANPLSQDQAIMRTTTVPSLLDQLGNNLRHTDRDVHLFEIGRIYLPQPEGLPEERRVLTAVAGASRTGHGLEPQDNDFFFMKSLLEAVLRRLGISGHGYVPFHHPGFHPYQTAAVVLNHRPEAAGKKPVQPDEMIGVLGRVDADVREQFDIGQECFLLAVDLDRLIQHASSVLAVQPLPRTPAVI